MSGGLLTESEDEAMKRSDGSNLSFIVFVVLAVMLLIVLGVVPCSYTQGSQEYLAEGYIWNPGFSAISGDDLDKWDRLTPIRSVTDTITRVDYEHPYGENFRTLRTREFHYWIPSGTAAISTSPIRVYSDTRLVMQWVTIDPNDLLGAYPDVACATEGTIFQVSGYAGGAEVSLCAAAADIAWTSCPAWAGDRPLSASRVILNSTFEEADYHAGPTIFTAVSDIVSATTVFWNDGVYRFDIEGYAMVGIDCVKNTSDQLLILRTLSKER
ncbi:MAG: hypothetical protein DRP56_05135 [Planctomycetota bacterium]|nr:MAG: hypothetical protein DRP56_05135 [Planctomycetota bacterium]